MSANPHRRGLLGLLAATPIAAAAGIQPNVTGASLVRRLSPGFASELSQVRYAGLGRLTDELGRTDLALDITPRERLATIPGHLTRLAAGLDSNPASIPVQQAAEARAIAALALAYPPEIAAYRSFGAPMRRRLYAEMLTRESVRLAAGSEPARSEGGSP